MIAAISEQSATKTVNAVNHVFFSAECFILFYVRMSVDFEKEIAEIKQDGKERLYSKKILDGKQRIRFSILAHLQGLVSQSVSDGKNSFLSISPPLNAEIILNTDHFGFFSHLVNKHVSCLEDVAFFNLCSLYDIYVENVKRNTAAGYKRYYEIMQDWLFHAILKLPNFNSTENVKEIVRERARKKPGIVFSPSNDGLYCVSVDVKSSVFQGYKELGVFEQQTWEEFISLHTHDQLLIRSKNLRLSVFGRCDVFKKNQIIINNTITPTWNQIVAEIPTITENLLFLSGDEAVFGYKDKVEADNLQNSLVTMKFPSHIVITSFRLEKKEIDDQNYFLRHFSFPVTVTDIKAASPKIIRQATEELRLIKK